MEKGKRILAGIGTQLFTRKWYFLMLLLFWVVILVIGNPFDAAKGTTIRNIWSNYEGGSIGELNRTAVYEQRFTAAHDNLQSVSVYIATFGRENAGNLDFSLVDEESGKVLYSDKVDVSQAENLSWLTLPFPRIADSKGRAYRIRLYADSKPDQGITVCAGFADDCEKTLQDGIELPVTMMFCCDYYDASLQNLKLLLWGALILLSVVFVFLVKAADEKMFLKTALLFGILFVFLNPFPHDIDESTGYFRSFMISQGDLIDTTGPSGEIGGEVSDNYDEIISRNLNVKSMATDAVLWSDAYSDSKSFFTNPYMASYVPVGHAVGAIGVAIGRGLHLPAYLVILLGRLTNLAIYVLLAYLAIKKAVFYKNLFFIVALMPFGMFLAASYSADPILIGGALLFTSICFSYRFDPEKQMTGLDMFLILLCTGLIASSKFLIYAPLLLMFFLIPRRAFSRKLLYALEIIAGVLIVAILAYVQLRLLGMFSFAEDRNGNVDVAAQIAFMLENKQEAAGILVYSFLRTAFEGVHFYFYSACYEFRYLLWWFILLMAVSEKKKYPFESRGKKIRFGLLLILIFCISWGLTVGALYVGYTPVGAPLAEGVQSRYLLPIFLMLLVPASLIPMKLKFRRSSELTSFVMGLGLLNVAAWMLLTMFSL